MAPARPERSVLSRIIHSDWTLRIGAVVFLLSAWEIASRVMGQLLMPSPARTVESFRELTRSGELWGAWRETLVILGIGLALITTVGITLGLILGRFHLADTFIEPVLTGLYVMPKLALLPIVVLWLGFQEQAKIVYIFLFGVFEVLFIVRNGVRAMEREYIEVSRAYMIPERKMMISIIMPAAVPYIVTGLRLGLLKGIEGAIITGFLLESNGIGGLIYNAGSSFQPEVVFAGLATVAVIGILINIALRAVERRVAPWSVERPT